MIASPQGAIKIPLFCLMLLTVHGCNTSSPSVNNVSRTSNQCPEKPQGILSRNNVKLVSLDSETFKDSGMISPGTNLGYAFEAKSGQILNLNTKDEICTWLYTPTNQLLKNNNALPLPLTGKYTIQLASRQGTNTFNLEMSLNNSSQTSISPNSTTASLSSLQATPNRPAADEFVKNHYLALKNRNYSDTWSELSSKFQSLSTGGYSDYLQWWNSVSDIKIGNIKLENQSRDSAVVNAELYYVMSTGKVF